MFNSLATFVWPLRSHYERTEKNIQVHCGVLDGDYGSQDEKSIVVNLVEREKPINLYLFGQSAGNKNQITSHFYAHIHPCARCYSVFDLTTFNVQSIEGLERFSLILIHFESR